MAVHYTYKGRAIDMGAMLMMNEHSIAVGNANMNARGDILGAGGTIHKTIETQTTEFYQKQVQTVVDTDEDVAFDMFSTDVIVEDESLEDMIDGLKNAEPIEPTKPAKRKKAPTGE